MLIWQLISSGSYAYLLSLITALVVGLTFHEFAHAWTAYRFGDGLAASQGRLTLNPLAHLDPIGAIAFLIVGFGWAKPVPVDPWRLDRRQLMLVSLAGPGSNLLLAALAGALVRLLTLSGGLGGAAMGSLLLFLLSFMYFNLLLAVFNMFPIPPLDGWKVLLGIVPADVAIRLRGFERYGPIALLVVVFLGFQYVWPIMLGIICPAMRLLAGPASALSGLCP